MRESTSCARRARARLLAVLIAAGVPACVADSVATDHRDGSSSERGDEAPSAATGDWIEIPFSPSPNVMDTRLSVAPRYIIIHTTEGSYASAIRHFQTPASHVSAHYVIRSRDGAITQMVPDSWTAWHAGNGFYNYASIGIEHEAVAREGRRWFTPAMLKTSASLVRALCDRYEIPCDRDHVIGHYEVPAEERSEDEFYSAAGFYDEAISDEEAIRREERAIRDYEAYRAAVAAARPSCRTQSRYFGGDGAHYDPGCDWNWATFMAQVNGTNLRTFTPRSNPGGKAELPSPNEAAPPIETPPDGAPTPP